ncbi:MAG: hypothetical protein JRI68_05410 [Deltaproteobacteria bacterium]|nr:hypothetical protein [Deltaproteobacteria bacterium]
MSTDSTTDGQAKLDSHPRRDALARLVRTAALTAADEQRSRFVDGLDELMGEAELASEDGVVGTFNVVEALKRAEPPVLQGRELLAELLARGVALEPPTDAAQAEQQAGALCWLSAHTFLDALPKLGAALEPDAAELFWPALGRVVRDADERGTPAGRAVALAALAVLLESPAPAAQTECEALGDGLNDPTLRRLCARGRRQEEAAAPALAPPGGTTVVSGRLVPAPFGPVGLVVWTVTGLMVIRYLLRFFGRFVLRLERPAEVKMDATGITVAAKLAVVGRTVGERQIHIPLTNLATASIEVRYPRLALYAGLLALATGTFVGVSLFVDGGRAGSPSLLALGAAVFGLGVLCDLVCASLWPSRRGQTRLVLVPRKGRSFALSTTERGAASAVLQRLADASK